MNDISNIAMKLVEVERNLDRLTMASKNLLTTDGMNSAIMEALNITNSRRGIVNTLIPKVKKIVDSQRASLLFELQFAEKEKTNVSELKP